VEGQEAAKANNAFAVDLYKQLSAGEGNLFFSPLSLATALSMTQAGADGATAEEMAKVLHLEPGAEADFGALLKQLVVKEDKYSIRLSVANALWLQQGEDFLDPFLQTAENEYGAGALNVDFRKSPEKARQQINAWVAERTQNGIPDLLSRGQIKASSRLVLTNALRFAAFWKDGFDRKSTTDADFHVSADRVVKAPLMYRDVCFGYAQGNGYQVVDLLFIYRGKAMLVVLPDAVDGLPSLEAKLTPELLAGWMNLKHSREVKLSLPKFKSSSKFDVKQQLSAMGMARAFGDDADFSRMTPAKDLYLSSVQHNATISVREFGVEAAAATASPLVEMSATIPVEPPVEMKVDHPFLYAIYDVKTGAVLFLGRMLDPTAG
jgi:serpin B